VLSNSQKDLSLSKKRTITIQDVARKAGVAPITVSRVINASGYIAPETRRRVEAAIEELHYVPNSIAASLRSKKSNTIALIVSDITNPFWPAVTRGVEDAGSEHGLNVVLCNTDEKPDKLDHYVNVLLQKQIDGYLLVPSGNESAVRRIQKQNVPLVVVDRMIPNADIVRSDSEQGAYDLTRYLIELGHRRIACLTGQTAISTSLQRAAGYQRAMHEHGLSDEGLILFGEFRAEVAHELTLKIMNTADPPTALFGANNFIAAGILSGVEALGLRVPEDVSVVAFDELPSFPRPFLTVVRQQTYALGYQASKLLIDFIEGRQQPGTREIVLPVELIVRGSCSTHRV
jgi:LacI family transcriptional regulator